MKSPSSVHQNALISKPTYNYFWHSSSGRDIREFLFNENEKEALSTDIMDSIKVLDAKCDTGAKAWREIGWMVIQSRHADIIPRNAQSQIKDGRVDAAKEKDANANAKNAESIDDAKNNDSKNQDERQDVADQKYRVTDVATDATGKSDDAKTI